MKPVGCCFVVVVVTAFVVVVSWSRRSLQAFVVVAEFVVVVVVLQCRDVGLLSSVDEDAAAATINTYTTSTQPSIPQGPLGVGK